MKQVLLKTIVIVVGKLIRSRVLWGGAVLRRAPKGRDGASLRKAPKGRDGARKFPHHVGRGEDGVRQNHAGRGRRPHPSA